MYELKQVGPQTYYINCPAKIGVYVRSEYEVYFIDSGNDKETAKKVSVSYTHLTLPTKLEV